MLPAVVKALGAVKDARDTKKHMDKSKREIEQNATKKEKVEANLKSMLSDRDASIGPAPKEEVEGRIPEIATQLDDPGFSSYYVMGSWIFSGEMHAYRKKSVMFHSIPVAKTVKPRGWGAWAMGFRYSSTELTDGVVDFSDMHIYSPYIN